ncbi:MAG: hypothetical protein WBP41_17915, partial [Saprospiraceae bacterium]
MAYVSDIGGIITQNRRELQSTIQNSSVEQAKALQQVCGNIQDGFAEMSEHLRDINYNISELRGEINEMSAMLDWKLSLMIEEQRVTNQLLGHIAQLLRIPDSQKQRVYHIEKGLKYLKSAIPDGFDSEYYADSLESFKEAENIERKDYITLNRMGQIYLYSKNYLNIPLAKEYFLKSAREASVEANAGGTTMSNNLKPFGQLSIIYAQNPFKAAAAEAYLYASRACYLEQNLLEAAQLAGKAYALIPEFVEAGFEQAKYLAANNLDNEAASVLEAVINKDRYYSIKTLSDQDLISKPVILNLLETLQKNAVREATNKFDDCRAEIQAGSEAVELIIEIDNLVTKKNYLSARKAIDLLNSNHQFSVMNYNLHWNGEKVEKGQQYQQLRIKELIRVEKENETKRLQFRSSAKTTILTRRLS